MYTYVHTHKYTDKYIEFKWSYLTWADKEKLKFIRFLKTALKLNKTKYCFFFKNKKL